MLISNCLRPVAAAALILSFGAVAYAQSYTGICTAVAGTQGGKRFASVKCYKESQPGNYAIRSIVWEHQDAKAYGEIARLSGARFSCTMSVSGSKVVDDEVRVFLKVSNCRGGAPRTRAATGPKTTRPVDGAKSSQTLPSAHDHRTANECYMCQPGNMIRNTEKRCFAPGTMPAYQMGRCKKI